MSHGHYPQSKSRALTRVLATANVLVLLSAAIPAIAEDGPRLLTTSDHEILAPDLDVSEERLQLTLDQAVELALRRNLSLVVERFRRSESILGIQEAVGIYDLNFQFDLSRLDDSRPVASSLESSAFTSDNASIQLSRLTPWGGTALVDFSNGRSESNNAFVALNPSYGLDLDVTFTQPLLRGFGRLATERNLLRARTTAAISREVFEQQVVEVIRQVSEGYWNLVSGLEQLRVSRESLELAEELHEMNRIQVEVGTKAPLEMVQSEAGVAARRTDIIRGEAAVGDAEDVLRQLLNLDDGPLWSASIIPTTSPEMAYLEVDVQAAISSALSERPEIRLKRLENEDLDVDARFFENQLKPGLSVSARYGFNGLGGRPLDSSVTAPRGWDGALEQLFEGDFTGWRLALTFDMPIQNRTAKAQNARADLAVERGSVELKELEQRVMTEVRRAARGVRTAEQQIESAKVSSRLARENLEAEQKRYENGLTTSFTVLQIQEDLAIQERQEVNAIIDYRRAVVDFHSALGELIDELGIELAD